jgi:hypothetical protein
MRDKHCNMHLVQTWCVSSFRVMGVYVHVQILHGKCDCRHPENPQLLRVAIRCINTGSHQPTDAQFYQKGPGRREVNYKGPVSGLCRGARSTCYLSGTSMQVCDDRPCAGHSGSSVKRLRPINPRLGGSLSLSRLVIRSHPVLPCSKPTEFAWVSRIVFAKYKPSDDARCHRAETHPQCSSTSSSLGTAA